MMHTYKRKGTSLSTCSFYERLCGDSLVECSARATNIEDRLPNGCWDSRENKKAKCKEWPESDISSNRKFHQSQPNERLDAPPFKFKYARRPKQQCKSGGSLQHVVAFPLIQEESRSISKINAARPESDRLCCDPCSLNRCGNDAVWPCGGLSSQNIRNEENHLDHRVCSNVSAKESTNRHVSILHKTDPQGRDTEDSSSLQYCVELGGIKCGVPIQTYSRRSRDNVDSHRTYAAIMAERTTLLAGDRNFSKNAVSPVHQAVVKTMELNESEIVDECSLLFSQSLGKLTDGFSSVGYMLCSQEVHKLRSEYPLFDDTDVSTIPSLNDEALTGQPDDTIKPQHNSICDLSLRIASEKHSTDTVMVDAYEAIVDDSQNHCDGQEKAGAASKDFSGCAISLNCSVLEVSYSDKQSEVDVHLAPSTKCQESAPLQSETLQQSAEKIQAASVYAEDPKVNSKELSGTMIEVMKESNGFFDINVMSSEDAVFGSPNNKIADPVASTNDSIRPMVLQLFPEDATDNALRHNTSKSELVPAISSNSCSVTVALPDLRAPLEIIKGKVVQSSSNQATHKLLLDSIRSSSRPQMEATEGFRQKFQPFASVWFEEELDNLWVGVRRHGKDNWYAILRDPRLRFSPWRTARDLAEKWIMEQTKLLGDAPGSQDQPSNPVGIRPDSCKISMAPLVPPSPGFMTRFLTDPMQLSLNNTHLNKQYQGVYPPRPPHNSTYVPGNGTRLFNRRVRAHRKTQRPESTWGRFKVGNQVKPPPQLPTSLASTSRINISPSYFGDALHYPHLLPPQPVPPLSAQQLSNQSPFHGRLNYNAIGSSSQNGFHLSNTVTGFPTLAAFPETQQNETKSTDPKRCKEPINLESDASSEGTISDGDKPRLTCK